MNIKVKNGLIAWRWKITIKFKLKIVWEWAEEEVGEAAAPDEKALAEGTLVEEITPSVFLRVSKHGLFVS